jgi:glycosyltransferase involved in cell wall biosynthesis
MKASPNAAQATPLVSVVVPTFNRRDRLRRTLDSIFAQTFGDFEVIVVSDGATDGTREMLAGWGDPRLVSEEIAHAGRPAPVRNKGMRRARGRYIAFCDDDDLWLPNKLAVQVAAMEAHPQAALCATAALYEKGERRWRSRDARRLDLKSLLRRNSVANSSAMIRRTVLETVGFFDEAAALKAVEDWEYWMRIAARHLVIFIDRELTRIYHHDGGISSARAEMSMRRAAALKSVRSKVAVSRVAFDLLIVEALARYGLLRGLELLRGMGRRDMRPLSHS